MSISRNRFKIADVVLLAKPSSPAVEFRNVSAADLRR
jgi:hypothetical protein